jgi:hypothetical protein
MKRLVVLCLTVFFAVVVNSWSDTAWINPTGGVWRESANWSFGVPDINQPATHIAFGGESKTVLVDAATPGTNLVIQRLNISGPGITNTLSLTGVVLEVRSTLEMRAGSVLHIVDSTLRLPSEDSSFDVNAGDVWLETGLIDATNVSSRIGRDGGLAVMRIDAGVARFGELLMGRRVSRSGAQGTLLLSGGLLQISGNLDVGADTNCLGQIVVTGGEMRAVSTNANAAIGEQGHGMLAISNGIVRFDELDVGRHTNVIGTLYGAGGSNLVEDLVLGRFPLSTGLVFQTAGRLEVMDFLRVGQQGRGEMTISGGEVTADTILVAGPTDTASGLLTVAGGLTIVESNLVVGTSVSTGQVILTGGVLAVTNGASSASLDVAQGVLSVSGGSVWMDRLQLSGTNGHMVFESGLLSSAGTIVSNGLPFVVGDGINAATFHLRGGTHTFPSGLVISANATLTGCGTIVGAISNQGTIATNCGPQAPLLVDPFYGAGLFSFSFQSQDGVSYIVEHAATIDATTWNVLGVTNGTGTEIIIRDNGEPTGNRFYRLRLQ